ncbi:MAG: DNA repair protein RecO C-terminal domain-containing protein, partial [Clostridia bacterium]|nr:DNA repair protein RecO C-terminal domain-containing protein [Clostridia bacterium]
SIYLLSKGKLNAHQVKSVAELRGVAMSGYAPNLIACAECGAFESNPMYFDIKNGDLHCNVCARGGTPISISTVTAMRHIIFSEAKKAFDFTLTENAQCELTAITEGYALEHTGRHFKTLDFYKSLQGI